MGPLKGYLHTMGPGVIVPPAPPLDGRAYTITLAEE